MKSENFIRSNVALNWPKLQRHPTIVASRDVFFTSNRPAVFCPVFRSKVSEQCAQHVVGAPPPTPFACAHVPPVWQDTPEQACNQS